MLESILKRFPHLKESDVTLQDDGEGAYVKEWKSEDPIPTSENLIAWYTEDMSNYTPEPSELEKLKKQQADLVFELMMKGVL